jgi:hypothetical protein
MKVEFIEYLRDFHRYHVILSPYKEATLTQLIVLAPPNGY